MSKFKIGDKVVPFQKTVGLSYPCDIWKKAQEEDKKFLYVVAFSNKNHPVLSDDANEIWGNWYSDDDLKLYEETKKKGKFKKHKFIPAEKLAKMINVKEINIGYVSALAWMQSDWVKTGYGQYTFFKAEDCEIFLKTIDHNDIVGQYKETFKLKDISKIPAFSSLDGYKKIKPIYIARDYYTREKINYDTVSFPSGKIWIELVGILVK